MLPTYCLPHTLHPNKYTTPEESQVKLRLLYYSLPETLHLKVLPSDMKLQT